ncbi:MAG: biosynthetic-type acetolactate synthase large subunit [Planctomycetaceae bacterium]|jgi:acetolactate synthase-1/2/3 large subunit|nr:biosynthetic-type acetolactate synthase large subunit [Planctomycetaceae bacterium]
MPVDLFRSKKKRQPASNFIELLVALNSEKELLQNKMSSLNTEVNLNADSQAQMSGADVLVQSLINAGVTTIFAYPGGCSIPLHQAMTRYRDKLRVVLPRHEQGGGFAAHGYARATGKTGVCMATSGPGATNLVTIIADAKLDSIPILAITGQVGTDSIGSDAFQETPMVEVCRTIAKHHYLVTDINDITRVVNEALYIASTGRPGPVLIDIPKNIQSQLCTPNFNPTMILPGYKPIPVIHNVKDSSDEFYEKLINFLKTAKRPIIYAGGGIVSAEASFELLRFAELSKIPVATTMMGLSIFPRDHELSLGMVGMHGTAYANRAVYNCDLLIALGVRFDDRVTGLPSGFAPNANIVHVDVDPSEINKIKQADIFIVDDVKNVLSELTCKLGSLGCDFDSNLLSWKNQIDEWKSQLPLGYDDNATYILPQYAIETLWNLTKDLDTIITSGVGQHQMWVTQYYRFRNSRTWISSCGLGTMGFGLPAAIGAKVAMPDKLVIDIDGDGSFQMNIQEMATCFCENIPVKVMLMNNQHLGMVVQWEDRFNNANRANTYLGRITDPENFGKGNGYSPANRYPDYIKVAEGYGWEALSVSSKSDLPEAIKTMINSPKAFLLDVAIPYKEHVLPMIPAGKTVNEIITI